MTMFTLPEGVSIDDFDEYESGCIDQRDRCEREAQILAFGAIRRAALIAREHDARAARHRAKIAEHVVADRLSDSDFVYDVENYANSIWVQRSCAEAVRCAIRSALRTEQES